MYERENVSCGVMMGAGQRLYEGEAPSVAPPPTLPMVLERMHMIRQRAAALLEVLRGPQPVMKGNPEERPVPEGLVGALHALTGDCQSVQTDILDLFDQIERAIGEMA